MTCEIWMGMGIGDDDDDGNLKKMKPNTIYYYA
jgi:hypothetical protein